MDATGNLYCTRVSGGSKEKGSVFKLTHNPDDSWTYTSLHDFTGDDGAYPEAGVILDANGNLYGTTNTGGAYNLGVLFEITQ